MLWLWYVAFLVCCVESWIWMLACWLEYAMHRSGVYSNVHCRQGSVMGMECQSLSVEHGVQDRWMGHNPIALAQNIDILCCQTFYWKLLFSRPAIKSSMALFIWSLSTVKGALPVWLGHIMTTHLRPKGEYNVWTKLKLVKSFSQKTTESWGCFMVLSSLIIALVPKGSICSWILLDAEVSHEWCQVNIVCRAI